MEFWGVEVKSGSTLKVQPGEDKVIHLSQACFGEVKKEKGNEFVRLYVQKDSQKLVIGILSLDKFPHVNFDLVFEDDFELSHDWKHGSVHFAGYKVDSMNGEDETDDDSEEPIPVEVFNNGRAQRKESKASSSGANSENAEGQPKVKIVEPAKDEEDDETEDDEDEDEDDESDEDEEDESEGGSDDEEDIDEETPTKAESSKKRIAGSALKTPAPDKKVKLATPLQKADGKKSASGHVDTPHPAKRAAKIPANTEKSNKQTPKSSGSIACSSCNKSFGSEQALQSHSKAKHGAK